MSSKVRPRAGNLAVNDRTQEPGLTPRIRCRQIHPADLEAVADLLTRGFRSRSREFWVERLKRLSSHITPPGLPRYGYLMEHDGTLVGTILLIFAAITIDQRTEIRCYVCSWCVEPEFSGHGAMLASHALKYKHVTYMNVTPPRYTWPMLDAQGYTRYCLGRYAAVPALSAVTSGCRVVPAGPDSCADESLKSSEIELLLRHAQYGCTSLICSLAGDRQPFVFKPGRKAGLLSFTRLVYCRSIEDFVRFAGALGRFLAVRGFPLVVVDANGPIKGLVGMYLAGSPKYFKGPDRPRIGDLAYSPGAIFEV
jgi:hypothetical protein